MNDLDLSVLFKTRSERQEFVTKLNQIIDTIFRTNFQFEKMLLEQYGVEIKDKFITLLSENSLAFQNGSDLKNTLELIRKTAEKLPSIEITLAFNPTENTLNILNDWFLVNLKHQFLLDIKVDKKIIAGISINYNGKFFENSIKPRVEQLVEQLHSTSEVAALKNTDPVPIDYHHDLNHVSLGR